LVSDYVAIPIPNRVPVSSAQTHRTFVHGSLTVHVASYHFDASFRVGQC
jgi:hypothetical protein